MEKRYNYSTSADTFTVERKKKRNNFIRSLGTLFLPRSQIVDR